MSVRTSVITPVRDGAAYIKQGLESALSQLEPHDECIVIDDGSKDETWSVVSEMEDSRIRLIRAQRPGVSAARNVGLALARGDLIAFLDADDEWLPGRHEEMKRRLLEDPELDVLIGRFVMRFEPNALHASAFEKFNSVQVPTAVLGTALFRRSVFDRVDGFAEDMEHAEDVDFFNRLEEVGMRSELISRDVCIYRRHSANVTNDRAALRKGFLEMLRRKVARAKVRGDSMDPRN